MLAISTMDNALLKPDPTEAFCHWTAYPCLLDGLETAESKAAIEKAAECRRQSRYREAHEIFDIHFPNKLTHTILVLEYIELLMSQRIEGQLVDLINEAIQKLSLEPSSSEFKLLQFAQAWAGFVATGNLPEALERAREGRRWLMTRAKENLAAVEVGSRVFSLAGRHLGLLCGCSNPNKVRAFGFYYKIMGIGLVSSNWVSPKDMAVFIEYQGDTKRECKEIAVLLKARGRLDDATNMLNSMYVSFHDESELSTFGQMATELCSALDTLRSKPALWTAAKLQFRMCCGAKTLGLDDLAEKYYANFNFRLARYAAASASNLGPTRARFEWQWEVECAKQRDLPLATKLQIFQSCADDWISEQGYGEAHKILRAAEEVASEGLRPGDVPTQDLRDIYAARMLDLSRKIKNAPLEVVSLCKVLGNLEALKEATFADEMILGEYFSFRERLKDFNVPTMDGCLLLTISASASRAGGVILRQLESDHERALRYYPGATVDKNNLKFIKPDSEPDGNIFIDLPSFFADLDHAAGVGYVNENGLSAVRRCIRWAEDDVENGLMTTSEWIGLFGLVASSSPHSDETRPFVIPHLDPFTVARALLKSTPSQWDAQYEKFREWLQQSGRPPSCLERLSTLKEILMIGFHGQGRPLAKELVRANDEASQQNAERDQDFKSQLAQLLDETTQQIIDCYEAGRSKSESEMAQALELFNQYQAEVPEPATATSTAEGDTERLQRNIERVARVLAAPCLDQREQIASEHCNRLRQIATQNNDRLDQIEFQHRDLSKQIRKRQRVLMAQLEDVELMVLEESPKTQRNEDLYHELEVKRGRRMLREMEDLGSDSIPEEELDRMIKQCEGLISRYTAASDFNKACKFHSNRVDLKMKKRDMFGSLTVNDILQVILDVEKAYLEAWRNLSNLDNLRAAHSKMDLSKFGRSRLKDFYSQALALAYRQACDIQQDLKQQMLRLGTADYDPSYIQELEKQADEAFSQFFTWVQRAKGRSHASFLGPSCRIPQGLLDGVRECDEARALLDREEQLVSRLSEATIGEFSELRRGLHRLRDEMRNVSILKPVMRIRDGEVVQASTLRDVIPPGVVLVEFVHMDYISDVLLAVCTRREGVSHPVVCGGDFNRRVQSWAAKNLAGSTPLNDATAWKEQLGELSPFLERLFSLDIENRQKNGWSPEESFVNLPLDPLENTTADSRPQIHPGDTVVFCPTGVLHQVPIHAIPVNGIPIIENHAVVYCQSLTLLYHCLQTVHSGTGTQQPTSSSSPKAVVVNPMPAKWNSALKDKTSALAASLHATYHSGWTLQRHTILDSLVSASVFHYLGHVRFFSDAPMDSFMCLDRAAYKSDLDAGSAPGSGSGAGERLSASDIFDTRLSRPALATLVGCRSGAGVVSALNDVLGFPTALHFAGVTAVVAALWKLDDADGVDFASAFYAEVMGRAARARQCEAEEPGQEGLRLVNLARAMQDAVKALRFDVDGRERAPYHWAGFALSGYWMFPGAMLPSS
jgi:CHAT domain-containing protein